MQWPGENIYKKKGVILPRRISAFNVVLLHFWQLCCNNSNMPRCHSNSIQFLPPSPPNPSLRHTSARRPCDWMSVPFMSPGQLNDVNFTTWTETQPLSSTGRRGEASSHPLVTLTRIPDCRWTVHTSIWGRGRPWTQIFPTPLSSSSSVRKPSGDQLVTRRPRVSTREYGGWVCPGERRGDGDVPDMVKDRQRDPSSLMKCGNTSPSGRCPKAASSLKNCACSWL